MTSERQPDYSSIAPDKFSNAIGILEKDTLKCAEVHQGMMTSAKTYASILAGVALVTVMAPAVAASAPWILGGIAVFSGLNAMAAVVQSKWVGDKIVQNTQKIKEYAEGAEFMQGRTPLERNQMVTTCLNAINKIGASLKMKP